MFFLLPLLALGALAFATRHRAPSAPTPASTPALTSGGTPSPLVVLDGYLRQGQTPPPPVILCALAQAETSGNLELANDIVRTFIAPVVYQAELAAARDATPYPMTPMAPNMAPPMQSNPAPTMPVSPGVQMPLDTSPTMAPPMPPMNGAPKDPRSWTNDEAVIAAALDAMANPGAGTRIIPADGFAPPAQPTPQAPPMVAVSGAAEAMLEHAHAQHVPMTSPIPGLPPAQWQAFASRIAREAPTFDGPRHVGAFRARKDRLVELGIDPRYLAGDPDLQLHALGSEMADAFHHAKRSGMLREHVKRPLEIHGAMHSISVSGVMAVIQAAGLEGAADWLDSPEDRERFPHTTAAFVRANGVF